MTLRDVWSFVTQLESGAQSVTTFGEPTTQLLSADSLDSIQMVCPKYIHVYKYLCGSVFRDLFITRLVQLCVYYSIYYSSSCLIKLNSACADYSSQKCDPSFVI